MFDFREDITNQTITLELSKLVTCRNKVEYLTFLTVSTLLLYVELNFKTSVRKMSAAKESSIFPSNVLISGVTVSGTPAAF